MDRRERYADPEEAMRVAMEGNQSKLWTALPAIVVTFDAARMVANVQPTVKGVVRQIDGAFGEIQMPQLLDCPVCFPGGGGVTLTFPVQAGDECLVVFASRCIDSWWQLGGVQGQAELRMHDLSDGFVLPGVRSQPRKFTVSTTAAQLRTDDGTAYVELVAGSKAINAVTPGAVSVQAGGNITATAGGSITATATGAITAQGASATVTAATITLVGNVTVQGNLTITGTTLGNGLNLNTHTHSGVTTGSGTSGPPS